MPYAHDPDQNFVGGVVIHPDANPFDKGDNYYTWWMLNAQYMTRPQRQAYLADTSLIDLARRNVDENDLTYSQYLGSESLSYPEDGDEEDPEE